jgi:tetratricopeptide (TPR) repeat protein
MNLHEHQLLKVFVCLYLLNAIYPCGGKEATQASGKPGTQDTRPYAEHAVDHYNKAVEFQRTGALVEAVPEYLAATKAEPRMDEAWTNLGLAYLGLNRLKPAGNAFHQALLLRPTRVVTIKYPSGELQVN